MEQKNIIMKDLYRAWRWSNLLSFSCWKYGLKNALFLVAVTFFMCLYFLHTDEFTLHCSYMFLIISVILLLSYVCCGSDRFVVSTDWSYLRVFVYPAKNKKHKIVIKDRYSSKTIYVDHYERLKGRIVSYFLFKDNNGNWVYKDANIKRVVSKRLSENVFLSTDTERGKAVISIMNSKKEYSYLCDFFVYNDFYRPKVKSEDNPTSPDEYILIRNKDKYQMIGIYQEADIVQYVHPPIIIFEELGDLVILTYDSHKKKYSEIHRKELNQRGNIRIKKSKDYVVGGQVLVFDQETQSYQVEYEGRIYGLDPKNNLLIGEDGWKIKLQPN